MREGCIGTRDDDSNVAGTAEAAATEGGARGKFTTRQLRGRAREKVEKRAFLLASYTEEPVKRRRHSAGVTAVDCVYSRAIAISLNEEARVCAPLSFFL